MSFLAPKTELPGGLQDNTPGRKASLSPNQVLPLVLGRGRVVAQWQTPVLHWRFRSTSTSQYAFFSGYAWLCLGPVDEIVQIHVNGKPYNGIFKFREDYPGTDYVDHVLSKETPEKFRIWWGLEDHANYGAYLRSLVLDPAHPMHGKTYPAYRGICALAVQDLEAGQSTGGQTPPIPKVEIELYRRSPAAYSFGYAAHGTHPIGTVLDLLTLKRGGLKLPASYFDSAKWTAAMQQIMDVGVAGAKGTDLFTSFVFAEAKQIDEQLADVLSYIDGYLLEREGKLEIGYCPNDGSTINPAGLTEINQHHLESGEIEDDPGTLDGMASQVIVTGLDWTAETPLSEASETAQVPFAQRFLGEQRPPRSYNRPGFVTREQLKSTAMLMAAILMNPDWSATVPILRQYAVQPDGVTPLRPGDLFVLNVDQVGGVQMVCRILSKESDTPVAVVFKVRRERGTFPRPYEPALDPRPSIAVPVPPALARYAAAQLPPALSESPAVALLVERPSTNITGAEVHFAPTNTWPGQVLGNVSTWAVAAVLDAALPDADADVTASVHTVGLDWLGLASQSALQQSDDSLLMYRAGEWCSVGTITPTGGGSYTVALKRARLGSESTAHAEGAVVSFAFRSQLVAWRHASFLTIQTAGAYDPAVATKWFKLRPYNSAGQGPLSDPFSLQLRNWWGEAPLLEIGALPGGAVTGVAYTLSGAIIDLSGDLDSFDVRLVRFDGADVVGEFTALSRAALDAEHTELEWSAPVVFPIAGTWRVVVRARDLAPNAVEESSAPFTVAAGPGVTGPDDGIAPGLVTDVTVASGIESLSIRFVPPTNTPVALVEVFASTTLLMPATPIERVRWPGTSYFHLGLSEGQTWRYWLRAIGQNGRTGDLTGPHVGTVVSWPVVDGLRGDLTGVARTVVQTLATANEAVAALLKEESDRVAAVAAENAGRVAAITAEATTRAAADAAETSTRTAQVAALQSQVDGKASIASVEAATNTLTTKLQALARTLVQMLASVNEASAAIVREEEVRATAVAAESSIRTSQVSALQDQVNDRATTAALSSEASTRAAADAAETSTRTAQVAALQSQVDSKASIASVEAATSTLTTKLQALARTLVQMLASVNEASAAIVREETVRADQTGSLAAEYTIQVITEGSGQRRVAGFRITNLGGAGGSTDFVLQADKVAIVNSSGEGLRAPFAVVGGVVYLDMAMIRNASITSAMIESLAANKISASTLSAITASLGNVTIGADGSLKSSGVTAFMAGPGVFLGYDAGAYKFRVGDPAGAYIAWNGTDWAVVGLPSLSLVEAPMVHLTDAGANQFQVAAPVGGAPSGFQLFYRLGSGVLQGPLTSFPFTLDPGGATVPVEWVTKATGRLPYTEVGSWNHYFV